MSEDVTNNAPAPENKWNVCLTTVHEWDAQHELKNMEEDIKMEYENDEFHSESKVDVSECVITVNPVKTELPDYTDDKAKITFSDDDFKIYRTQSNTDNSLFSDDVMKEVIKEEQIDLEDVKESATKDGEDPLDPLDVKNDPDNDDSTIIQCSYCKVNFETDKDLEEHLKDCSEKPSRSDGLRTSGSSGEHRIIHTAEKDCYCEKCPNAPLEVQDAKLHCDICCKHFKTKDNLKAHQAVVHSDERPYTCEKCPYKAKRKRNLISHQQIHADVMEYQCDLCFKLFKTQRSLKYHQVNHNNDTSYNCHKCSYKTKWGPNLQRHCNAVHEEARKWQCDICPMQFKNKQHLRRHHTVHSDEKRYFCDKCSYKTKWETSIVRHRNIVHERVRNHNGEKLYSCDMCSYRANTKGGIVQHRYVHVDAREVCCDVCSQSFKSNMYLKLHRVVHTDEKPYACEKCPFRSKRKGQLVVHRRTHDEVKKFECDVCFKQFKDKRSVKVHRSVHNDEKPYKCEKCSYKAKWRRCLSRHQLTHAKMT